jgi:hypothetical protein
MNINSFQFVLPLADLGDLIGVIIFIIIAGLSALANKFGKKDENSGDDQPHRPTSDPARPTDLAEEMRKFLEEVRREHSGQPTPPPLPQEAPPVLPPLTKHFEESEPEPEPVPVAEEHEVSQGYLAGDLDGNIQEEVHDSMTSSNEAVEITEGELTQVYATPEETVAKSSFNISLLRDPEGLKQALILSEVLGKPRSSRPY